MNQQQNISIIPTDNAKKPFLALRRSCTTGQPVWLYAGTRAGISRAYYRACKKESTRVRWWCNRLKRRQQNIRLVLDELIGSLPILGTVTKQQRKALRELRSIANEPVACDTAFHSNFLTERRRREQHCEQMRRQREREQRGKVENTCYDK